MSLVIHNLGTIDELQMKFRAKISLQIKWKDPRLTYRSLKNDGNILSKDNSDEIWIPDLEFTNTEKDLSILKAGKDSFKVQVLKKGQVQKIDAFIDLHYHETFSGQENDLFLVGKYEEYFTCTFDLKLYPFDTQNCFMNLSVPETQSKDLKLTKGNVTYQGPLELLQFKVQNTKLELKNDNTEIYCQLTLKRTPLYHMTTTYLPTFCILVMAIVTLYIDEKHFEATIMVALTAMLVMYTLFQSISEDTPNTAYLKFLDYWLIVALITPFVVFMLEVGLELWPRNNK